MSYKKSGFTARGWLARRAAPRNDGPLNEACRPPRPNGLMSASEKRWRDMSYKGKMFAA